ILQVWTEGHGRLGLVAKGARRAKSASRSLLVPFQPLSLDWFGRGELKTLKTAEPLGAGPLLAGAGLFSGFYLNELLLKLTSRDDPHEGLFVAYDSALAQLRGAGRGSSGAIEPVLRRFELTMLQELGYAVELKREATTHVPVVAEEEYLYVVERGPIPAPPAEETPANAVRLRGLTLLNLASGRFDDALTASQAKSLMRLLINHSLNGQELATRRLIRDLQRLQERL